MHTCRTGHRYVHIMSVLWNSKYNYCVVIQYIPRNMHMVFALLCFVVVIHWLIFPYPSGLLHWHCGNLTSAPVPAKQPWWIWINTSCEFIMNDCITTTKQSTLKPCAYFLGYTVYDDNSPTIDSFVFPWRCIERRPLSAHVCFIHRLSGCFYILPSTHSSLSTFDQYWPLTHYGLVTPYDRIYLSQYWLR